MDLISSLSSSSSCLILLLTSILVVVLRNRNKKSKLPPGPWKLPIIGNLHQLIGDHPHRRLKDLATKYGPDMMHIQLGELSHVVISSSEAAKQVMKTHDLAFASRPFMLGPYIFYYGFKDVAFAPYGEYWRQMRKFCVLELLSSKRVLSFRHIREEEVSNLVESLNNNNNNEPVDLSSMVVKVSGFVTSRAAFGKVAELSDAFMTVIDNISDLLSGFRISDMYPSLGLLPVLTGFKGKAEKMHKASDLILEQIIDEHKSKRRLSKEEDLVDVLLNLQESQNLGIPITMDVIKAIVLIIRDQRVLRTVQEEVRQVFKNTGNVEEARLNELKYLDMAISEGLRLHPPGPLLVPRENVETVKLSSGYEFPAKTKVLVNVWAINRDPRYWKEPEKFYPERFVDCSTDYNGNYFEFIPFGAGRRMCPGISFAMVIVKLALANMFFHFNWRLPGPWKLPIIGNLHQLIGDHPHRRLKDLATKYGPYMMHIQLGELSHIVISSPEAAKQVMKTHDLAFASRPFMLGPYILYNGYNDIAFAPYGEYWRQMRKYCVLELLSSKRVLSFRHIREEEVSNLVESLNNNNNNEPVDLSSMVVKVSGFVTSRAAFGKVAELSDAFMTVIDNISDLLSGLRISDMYPSLGLLPVLTGFKGKAEKMHKASDSILEQIIEEHKSKRRLSKDEDLVDVLLNLQESQNLGIPITMDVIKAIVLEMFLAGIETSSTTIAWVMSEIIKDQRVLRTVQEEVRQVFKNTRNVEEARLNELKYLDMAISEGLRLHPPVPLLVPRENTEKVELHNGYEIPAKTKVLVNAWAINRDPRYWKEPEKFYPERFLDCSTDYKGNDFEFIPFGAGRRMCPGIAFGMVIVKLVLANLFFHFDWRLPGDLELERLDMTESVGLGLMRKHPLCLIPVPYNVMA
ncbi:Premnaspirodiene oxygenase [Linum perenne]